MPVAGIAGRQDAVKHVDTGIDGLDDIFRRTDPHQVAWRGSRHGGHRVPQDMLAFFPGLTDRESTEGVAVKTDFLQAIE